MTQKTTNTNSLLPIAAGIGAIIVTGFVMGKLLDSLGGKPKPQVPEDNTPKPRPLSFEVLEARRQLEHYDRIRATRAEIEAKQHKYTAKEKELRDQRFKAKFDADDVPTVEELLEMDKAIESASEWGSYPEELIRERNAYAKSLRAYLKKGKKSKKLNLP
jgi:hypothetical protein